MKRSGYFVCFLCLCLLGLILVSGCGKDKFVGKWTPVRVTMGGQSADIPADKRDKYFEIAKEGNDYVVTAPDKKDKERMKKDGEKLVPMDAGGKDMQVEITIDAKSGHLMMSMAKGAFITESERSK